MAGNVFESKLHIVLPRGSWPKEERRIHLKLEDDLLTGLSSPLILEKAPAQ